MRIASLDEALVKQSQRTCQVFVITFHLYEAAANLGGHARTIGQNVHVNKMPPGKITKNSPIGFRIATSPTLNYLLKKLGIPKKSTSFGSNLFLQDNQNHYPQIDLQHLATKAPWTQRGWTRNCFSLARFLYRTRCSRRTTDQKHSAEVLSHLHFLRNWTQTCTTFLRRSGTETR